MGPVGARRVGLDQWRTVWKVRCQCRHVVVRRTSAQLSDARRTGALVLCPECLVAQAAERARSFARYPPKKSMLTPKPDVLYLQESSVLLGTKTVVRLPLQARRPEGVPLPRYFRMDRLLLAVFEAEFFILEKLLYRERNVLESFGSFDACLLHPNSRGPRLPSLLIDTREGVPLLELRYTGLVPRNKREGEPFVVVGWMDGRSSEHDTRN